MIHDINNKLKIASEAKAILALFQGSYIKVNSSLKVFILFLYEDNNMNKIKEYMFRPNACF